MLEDSFWIKIALYGSFALCSSMLVLKGSSGNAFAEDPFKGALCGLIIAVTAIVMFQISLQGSCRRNSRVVLVLGGLVGHLLMVHAVMGLAEDRFRRRSMSGTEGMAHVHQSDFRWNERRTQQLNVHGGRARQPVRN